MTSKPSKLLLAAAAAALGLSAVQANAQAPFSPRVNDETDTRWIYRAPGSGVVPTPAPSAKTQDFVRYNDETDLRWLYRAPGAQTAFKAAAPAAGASVGSSQQAIGPARHDDETDLRWMDEHKPPFKR